MNAEALSDVGEAAQSVSGAGQIANEPIREAAEIASTLGLGADDGLGEDDGMDPGMDSGMFGAGTTMGAAWCPPRPWGTARSMDERSWPRWSGRWRAWSEVRIAIMPQPMSTPTAAGMIV